MTIYQLGDFKPEIDPEAYVAAEATVIGHEKGTGRCETMCGAIIVREKDGTEFKIGSGFSDAQRRSPPKKGSVVTFKF